MFQLVEITGVMNEKNGIEVPAVLLSQTGIKNGEEVKLIYLAAGEKDFRNESREFILAREGENPAEELLKGENVEFRLPPELLADAKIPADSDLEIVCMDKKIVILPSEDTEAEEMPKELLGLCEELGISREKVNIVLRVSEPETEAVRNDAEP